jgi:hypothetical protein
VRAGWNREAGSGLESKLLGSSVADHYCSYQRGPRYQIALKHCLSLMLPPHFDHAVAKLRWTPDFNNGVRR